MKTLSISHIDEIHQVGRGHWTGHYVYRGENSASYTLRPKLGRHLAAPFQTDDGKSFPACEHEQSMLHEFKRRAAPFLDKQPVDDWDWLAVAQHHGLATRLLDWTTNILVATYFAVCDRGPGDAVIYALNTESLLSASGEISPFEVEHDAILHPRHINARISAQAGLFTSHADPTAPFEDHMLQRIVIPSALHVDLSTTLSTYHINRATLFPGLDSLAADVNEGYGCT